MRQILAAIGGALILISCAGPARPVPSAVLTDRVLIFDDPSKPETQWGFDPARIEVAAGTPVTFRNTGAVFHTVTSDDPARTFDKGASPGEVVRIRLDKAGTWSYHCGVHPDMKGTIVVR